MKEPVLINNNPNIYKFKDFYYIPSVGYIYEKELSVKHFERLKHKDESKTINFNKIYPTTIGLNITNACNLRCIYCYSETSDEKKETLSDEIIDTIVSMLMKNAIIRKMASSEKKLPKTFVILSGGGEPTYYTEKFKTLVKRIKAIENSKIHLVTNGMFSAKTAKFIINNVDSINFSFDGTPFLQNKQRPTSKGNGSFDVIYKNIKLFDEQKKEYSIRTTISEENFCYIEEMSQLIFNNFKYIKSWQIESVFKSGRACNLCINQQANFSSEFDKICEYVYSNHPQKMIFNTEFSYILKDNYCAASNGTNFWIDAYGDIVECSSVEKKDVFKIGRIDKKEIIIQGNNHKEFTEYRERMLKMCKDCFIFNICAGGCPEKMLRDKHGEFINQERSAKCLYMKSYWKNKIEMVFKKKQISDIRLELHETIEGTPIYKIVQKGEL